MSLSKILLVVDRHCEGSQCADKLFCPVKVALEQNFDLLCRERKKKEKNQKLIKR